MKAEKLRSVVSVGNFDGIHQGHLKLVQLMLELARRDNLRSVIITYDKHPAYTLNQHAQPVLLMPVEQKRQKLLELGIDHVELIHFDAKFASISAGEFLHEYLVPTFAPHTIVVGYDSHFGHQREGNLDFLKQHAPLYGYELQYVEPAMYQQQPVSSSLIRDLLLRGKLTEANTLLSAPYALYGRVVHGTGKGKELGFPTANLDPGDPQQLIPLGGIYLSRVYLDQGTYFGLTNIGLSPTLKPKGKLEVETYILDFNQQIYGCPLKLELLSYLREEKVFQTREELILAIRADLALARKMIGAGAF